ncbi:MAG: SMI1/KNR4 family protein [Massilibacteroides sp.]|nr:SMI1/KNR4 family protein [Massilibacteroides sp.]
MREIHWENTEKKREDLDELIPCIEKAFRLILPEDFKMCAIENGGGSPTPCRFDVGGEKGKTLVKLFSLDPRSKDFFWRYCTALDWCQLGFFWRPYPIAQDAEGNYIGLDYEKGFLPKIAYVKAKWASTRWKHTVSDSFTAFLEMLY